MQPLLTASALCERLPHADRMCLLNALVAWDETGIHCTTRSHRRPDNPLCAAQGLPAICGVEYAAQAMAVHGGLCADRAEPLPAVLAAVRNLDLYTDWLHGHGAELEIFAQRLRGDRRASVYDFRITAQARVLLTGRLTVAFKAAGKAP